jgi:hypothetical protein
VCISKARDEVLQAEWRAYISTVRFVSLLTRIGREVNPEVNAFCEDAHHEFVRDTAFDK